MPAAYLLLRLPDLIIGFLDLTAISVPLACASDAIQIAAFIVSSLQVSWLPLHRSCMVCHNAIMLLPCFILCR